MPVVSRARVDVYGECWLRLMRVDLFLLQSFTAAYERPPPNASHFFIFLFLSVFLSFVEWWGGGGGGHKFDRIVKNFAALTAMRCCRSYCQALHFHSFTINVKDTASGMMTKTWEDHKKDRFLSKSINQSINQSANRLSLLTS